MNSMDEEIQPMFVSDISSQAHSNHLRGPPPGSLTNSENNLRISALDPSVKIILHTPCINTV